jgi:hypothetical protein
MQALAKCVKAIQGMTGKARNSQAPQDLQCVVDATQACLQTNPHRFEETITPDHFCNTQRVPRVQAPASIPIPHTNVNRRITCSMQPQAPIPRVPTDTPRVKPISMPRIATITESSSKPTTLAAESSKCNCQHKHWSSQLHNAVTELEHKWQQQQLELHPPIQTLAHACNTQACHHQHVNQATLQQS